MTENPVNPLENPRVQSRFIDASGPVWYPVTGDSERVTQLVHLKRTY